MTVIFLGTSLVVAGEANSLTFKKGEKKSFDKADIEGLSSTNMTKEEKKAYDKDQAQADSKNIFQMDWRQSKEDDHWGSFRSSIFHNELISGSKFPSVGTASSQFDGVYKYDFKCQGSEVGHRSPWDGSKFLIRKGVIENNRGGAGRIKMTFGSIDENGQFLMKFFRSSGGNRYTGRDYLFSGNLSQGSMDKFQNRHLSGNFYGFAYKHPVKGGERDDGKYRYDLGCVGFLEKVEDISEMAEAKSIDSKSFIIKSRNPVDAWSLLNNEGNELDVELKIIAEKEIKTKGVVIVLPSSGPDMSDEEYYAEHFTKMGFATAILYGAEPRYSSKFSTSYTSYMQARDAAAAIEFLGKKFGLGKIVAIAGSSQGSLAALRTVMKPYKETYPSLAKISHVIMFNGACPDVLEVPINKNVKIITLNGRSDNAIPPSVCANMKKSSKASITALTYDGSHHFESPFYRQGVSDGKHLLANCAITVHDNLDESVKVRVTGKTKRLSKGGSYDAYRNWLISNCLGTGTKEGYVEESAKKMWKDLELFLK